MRAPVAKQGRDRPSPGPQRPGPVRFSGLSLRREIAKEAPQASVCVIIHREHPRSVKLLSCLRPVALAAAIGALFPAAPGIAAPHAAPHAAAGGQVALTFDDLPAITLVKRQDYVDDLNRRLLAGLRRHHIRATGFVVESKLDELDRARQTAILRRWLNAGMDLGNHTFSHESPNELGAAGYTADIAQGEVVTKKLLAERGRRESWFRAPNLETGSPMPVKREIEDWLAAHGYRMAPVSLNATDWQFAEPYDDAIAHHDAPRARRLRAAYLRYTARMIPWYRQQAHILFGRDIAHVMLLHASRLNADCIDDLVAMLRRNRLRPVSLDQAMRDPAYRTADHYAEKDGIDWMERWAQTLGKSLDWDSFQDVPKDVQRAYDMVDSDRTEGDSSQAG